MKRHQIIHIRLKQKSDMRKIRRQKRIKKTLHKRRVYRQLRRMTENIQKPRQGPQGLKTYEAIAYHFFTTNKRWLKNLLTILAPLVLSVFVLALFPSCQIPLGIIAFCLFVGALVRDKEKINFEKKDIFRILFIFLVAIIILSYSLLTSLDAIKLLYDTVYPGKRVSLGGQYTFRNLFTNLTTLFLPYKESNVLNNCEVSDFIHIVIP